MGPLRSLIKEVKNTALDAVKPKPEPPVARRAASSGSSDGKKRGRGGKFKAAFAMTRDANVRRARSLNLTHGLAYSLVIAIFLGLTLGGDYPAPKAEMEEAGVWVDYVVKYALYMGAGVLGVAAVLLANRALAAGRGTALPQAVLLVTVLSVLATIGLTIYLLTINLGYSWWDYLLNVLMLIQRLLFFVVGSMALYTLWEADKDTGVAGHVAAAQGVAPAPPAEGGYSVV
ncbi:expressed protein [Chlorella variabilis]|uniref:Expressed protein n=1 Tax=Chlorella variabilis TaxID=554065 RepID=E1ZAJ8_CHLVA|nr:expressed protein [Chlorella variabilis]EFN57075.1 expressed protein [Chlorella variabilis]|eukprot:XP_005849177.1 expressed protein [Chlorella variabilis]